MEWIKVEDRLPEFEGLALVFGDNIGMLVRPYNCFHNCWDDEDGDDYYCDALGGKITHWMPLPEPPKS
jgi:uncharacterized protein DUF551